MTLLLATKLHIPTLQSKHVARPRLLARLDAASDRRLILVSGPAGFGKTTLISAWVTGAHRPIAWLSLDEDDNDPVRLLSYLIAALQRIENDIGVDLARALQTPQPPPLEACLTNLLNEIAELSDPFTLVLDDYHVINSSAINAALAFLLENAPATMQVVILTREDPQLPLHKLRAHGHLVELRAGELRFTLAEATEFLNKAMALSLTADDIAALDTRTEGWIAGLQLAAISMHGQADTSGFIRSFSGSHRFVMDYLVEEVLHQLPNDIQEFLLHTAILDRMCAPLCEAVLGDASTSGQATLALLEQSNLFIVPLDDERRWYRYHHLFAELLRQRLLQGPKAQTTVDTLYRRASTWCADNGLDLEAFHYAAAGHDIDRAEQLIDSKGIGLHLRGAVTSILRWFDSLSPDILSTRPQLLWRHASLLLISGQTSGVDEKLNAAERCLPQTPSEVSDRNLIGQIATARATLALTRYQVDRMIAESRRALSYLSADKPSLRASANWVFGYAHLLLGERQVARAALTEAIALSKSAAATFSRILATIGLGQVQELNNELDSAVETYREALQLAGDQPLQILCEAHLGLARVLYEWNDLAGAERHAHQSDILARQYEKIIDRFIITEVFLARLRLAYGDGAGAAALLAQSYQSARQRNFVLRIPEVVAAQVQVLLRQGDIAAADQAAKIQPMPLSQAQVYLAQNNPIAAQAALTILSSLRERAETKGWADERLKLMTLQSLGLAAQGQRPHALQTLSEALALAEVQRFTRLFVDLNADSRGVLTELLTELVEKAEQAPLHNYVWHLLQAIEAEAARNLDGASIASPSGTPDSTSALLESLSTREQEVLQLIAQGLSNREIGERLFLALDTVKGHNRKIFEKLQVQRRTEAVAAARRLGLV